MEGVNNTYIGAMNKDMSPLKMGNSQTIHAENIRVFTNQGGTTTAIEDVVGNTSVVIDDQSGFGYDNYDIIDSVSLGKDIVLFYAGKYYLPDYFERGAIALLKYREENSYYKFHLYGNPELKAYPNESVVPQAYYENERVQKIYWTIRGKSYHLNIAPLDGTDGTSGMDYQDVMTTPFNKIQFLPGVRFSKPLFR